MDSENELLKFLSSNKLPCFAYLKIDDKYEEVYFHRIFKSKTFVAKCYSENLENYLLNKRPSVVYLDTNDSDTNTITPICELFIPFDFKGFFEIFSSNSFQLGGILDHETNVISFSSKIKQPQYYYVAKDLMLYETVKFNSFSQRYKSLTSSINIFDKVNKKWKKFSEGTILKATKLDDVDYLMKKNSCYQLICCRFDAKTRFELAIEFKLIDYNELTINQPESKKKSYYLPVDTVDNLEIDVIPIEANISKNLKLNSLQLIRNFSKLNLKENLINLKLFRSNHDLKSSIFELNHYSDNCEIISGYFLKDNRSFFTPIKSKSNQNIKVCKIDDIEINNEIFKSFLFKLTDFKQKLDEQIEQFDTQLTKIETFNAQKEIQNQKVKKINKIIHFSDLANLGKSFSTDTLQLGPRQKRLLIFKRNKFYSFKETSKMNKSKSNKISKTPINSLKRSKSVD